MIVAVDTVGQGGGGGCNGGDGLRTRPRVIVVFAGAARVCVDDQQGHLRTNERVGRAHRH